METDKEFKRKKDEEYEMQLYGFTCNAVADTCKQNIYFLYVIYFLIVLLYFLNEDYCMI